MTRIENIYLEVSLVTFLRREFFLLLSTSFVAKYYIQLYRVATERLKLFKHMFFKFFIILFGNIMEIFRLSVATLYLRFSRNSPEDVKLFFL